MEWLEATQLVSGLLGLLQPLLPYCHHLFKVYCPSFEGDIDSPDLSEIKLQVGGRQSAPRGGALHLSSLWVEASWLRIQEMEFEFFRQHVALQGIWSHRKNRNSNRGPSRFYYTWMQSLEWWIFLPGFPRKWAGDFYYWASIVGDSFGCCGEGRTFTKTHILSSNNNKTQSNASNSNTWTNTSTSSQMASFCFHNCREQNDNQREKSLTLSYLGVGGGQLSREIFPRNDYLFSCSSTVLSSQSLWSSFTSNTPEAFGLRLCC